MLSLPEDWDYTLAGLSFINREKIDAIREAVKELERAGVLFTRFAIWLTLTPIFCISAVMAFMSVWSTWIMYPSMAIFLRYAAMFRVGTSFIFSRIKSRSASVTLNLICTVLLRPSMLSLLSIPRVWDTSQQAIFYRRAATREGENTEVGTRFLCLLRKFFLTPYYNGKPRFANFKQKKNAAISKRLQRFLKPI
mgnify:CR=1 FL=1